MAHTSYRTSTWFDPRLALRPSHTHGQGLFATTFIRQGEAVLISGGTLYTAEDLHNGKVPPGLNIGFVEEDLVMATPIDAWDYYINHSCDPNIWMVDAVTLVARRDIQSDEEITLDYATGDDDPTYCLAPCTCGSALCRTTITGDDWRLPDLQGRYRGHFTPFLNRRIAQIT